VFDSLVALASPKRSRLAGTAAAMAHGLAFAGIVGAALWNPCDLGPPDPPDPVVFPVALAPRLPDGGGAKPPGPVAPDQGLKSRPVAAVFPTRLPDANEERTSTEPELTGEGPMERGRLSVTGPGVGSDGSGSCPDCPGGSSLGLERVYPPGGDVTPPVLLFRVEPVFPDAMLRARQEGTVVLVAIIGREGSIEESRVVTATNSLFEAAALQAVRQWRYRAGRLNDQPVRVILRVTVSFRQR